MTLIVTVISNLGIIQASDSNLTTADGKLLRPAKKVFRIGFAHGALSFSGRNSVGGQLMQAWMPRCIGEYRATAKPTLEGFANHLRDRLEAEVTDDERRDGELIQIAGYAESERTRHPEMWFVRNLGMGSAGEYTNPGPFAADEHFWNRDYPQQIEATFFRKYFNGYPDGRIAYLGLTAMLWNFYQQQIWGNPLWKFRAPRTLDELAYFVRLEMDSVITAFGSSDYLAPPIGGKIQLVKIPPPPGTVTL